MSFNYTFCISGSYHSTLCLHGCSVKSRITLFVWQRNLPGCALALAWLTYSAHCNSVLWQRLSQFLHFCQTTLHVRPEPSAFAPHHSGLIKANVGAAVRLALSGLQLKCSSDGWTASETPSSYTFLTSELLPTFLTKSLLFFLFFSLQKEWFMYKDEPISQSLWYTEILQSSVKISKLCPNNRGEYHSDITKIRGSVGTRDHLCWKYMHSWCCMALWVKAAVKWHVISFTY